MTTRPGCSCGGGGCGGRGGDRLATGDKQCPAAASALWGSLRDRGKIVRMSKAVMTIDVLRTEWEKKKPKTRGPCGFCGTLAPRALYGVRWIPVDESMSSEIDLAKHDGMLPCAVLSFNSCGLVSYINLLALGIVSSVPKREPPKLVLLDGGDGPSPEREG